jgi:hypothetical protein
MVGPPADVFIANVVKATEEFQILPAREPPVEATFFVEYDPNTEGPLARGAP